MKITEVFSLKTKDGSRRLFALCLALILVFSFCARMISSNAGQVKISRVTVDARGAALSCELYYPAGTKDDDCLPAVILTHGGGVTRDNVKGFVEELARRGFVVLSVNAYGVGQSEEPRFDEGGQGENGMIYKKSPGGVYDALSFLRTLKFVDQTRIGVGGHSAGSRRSAFAAIMDCGYYTLNDLMLNDMVEHFGLSFTEDEISQDADTLAQAKLNADQMKLYEMLKEKNTEYYNTRVKAACLIGSNANLITPLKEVEVAGHTVMRNCQTNFGIVTGEFDYNYKEYINYDSTKEAWFTGGQSVQPENWYALDDLKGESTILGTQTGLDVTTSQAFKDAIENRDTRIICFNKESHSKNFFSKPATGDVVKYFEQVLQYNCGELNNPATVRLDPFKTVFMVREWFNLLAMIAMVLMVIALAAMLLQTRFFASCVAEAKARPTVSKASYAVFLVGAVVVGFVSNYLANLINGPVLDVLPWGRAIPYFPSWWITVLFIAALAVGGLIILLICKLVDKSNFSLAALNVKMKVVDVLKTILLGMILLTAAYLSMALIETLFGQDYRFWMAAFSEMRTEYWRYVWRIAILMFPTYAILGASVNYTARLDIPEWQDTLITVVVNTAGISLCCLANFASLNLRDTMFSTFISTYGFLVLVPITTYITRKMYKLTNSIWLGAAFNSLLISWSLNTTIGLHTERFFGQTWLSNFLNL